MASLVNIANGNFTAAATWGVGNVAGTLLSTNTAGTALTVAVQDSAVFVPGAVTVIGVMLRLTARAAGAPTNTITVTLRNSTGGVDVKSVTANVSDLPVSVAGNDSEGGWHFFKFDAAVLLLAATNYVIRCSVSATTTSVSLATNGTAANWQRVLVTDATAAPAAGDDLWLAQTLDGATNPATLVARTVTMNETAATDYGTAVVSIYQPALSVSKNCTLSYGTTAATNYLLRISGLLSVYSGGTFNIGSAGAEIPRNSTAVLEFDNAADGQFGLRVLNLGVFNAHGLSRTAGKDIWMALLTADEAVASTTIDIDQDSGWLNGDEVLIASTSRTAGQSELRTLNANAGATSFTIGAGLTNAHLGSGDYFAEVFLMTRNVEIRSVSTTNMMYFNCQNTATVSCKWMRWRYWSSISGGGLWTITTTTGTATFQYCVWRDSDQGISTSISSGGWTIDKSIQYNNATTGNAISIGNTSLTNWVLTDFAVVECSGQAFNMSDVGGTIGSLWAIGTNGFMTWNEAAKLNDGTGGPTFSGGAVWTVHSMQGGAADAGLQFSATCTDITFPTMNFWRNNTGAMLQVNSGVFLGNVEFTGNFFANGVTATEEPCCFIAARNNGMGDIRFRNCNISGDTTFQANWGCLFDGFNVFAPEIRWINCKFSENAGTRRPLLVADIGVIPDINSGTMLLQGIADDCAFGAPESVKFFLATGPNPRLASKYSYVLCPRYGQSGTAHRMYTAYGTIIRDTTTFDVGPASQNIKPIASTSLAVDSNGFRPNTGFLVAVNSGATVTPSVRVEIDAGYNGLTKPQLVVLANRAAGINTDTVLATHSGATGAFETLSAATAAVAADCVLEFVVRCYGTAGNAWVDTWSTSASGQDTTGDRYWNGQPITNANTSGGGGGGGEHSAVF